MTATTIKISTELRDRLADVARDYGGVTLADTLRRLLDEHEEHAALAAYDELRRDQDAWSSYRDESRLTDNTSGDWMLQDGATSPAA